MALAGVWPRHLQAAHASLPQLSCVLHKKPAASATSLLKGRENLELLHSAFMQKKSAKVSWIPQNMKYLLALQLLSFVIIY